MTATEFTPLASTIGGALIGAAAVILLALNGRIAGISGIVGRLLPPYTGVDPLGAAAFLLGLLGARPWSMPQPRARRSHRPYRTMRG